MTVDLDHPAGGTVTHRGQEIGLCSPSCRKKFEADPERYLGARKSEPPTPLPAAGTEWTCPMHPEAGRMAKGPCPICRMALEPRTGALDETNPELDDMSRRFWSGLVFTVPVLMLGMSDFLLGMPAQHA